MSDDEQEMKIITFTYNILLVPTYTIVNSHCSGSIERSNNSDCVLFPLSLCGLSTLSVLDPRLWNSLRRLLQDAGHNTSSFGQDIFLSVHTVH